METVVIALEELAHYAESTARTMPVTGVVPRTVAEDQIRHALRALREKRRRLDASAPDGGARWLLDNLWLCEREANAALAAFHAAGRLRTTCEGALVPALCRVLLASGGGRVDEERIAVFLEGFQRKTPLTGRELALLGASLRAAVLVRLAQLYRGDTPSGAAAAVYFTALRHIASLDLDAVLEEADAVEHILRRDPAGVYPRMDERSRRDYRARVETLSRRKNKSEARVAEEALRLAEHAEGVRRRHIGYWLYENPLGTGVPRRDGAAYILANVLFTLALSAASALWTKSVLTGVLALLPVSELVKGLLDRVLLRAVPPRRLPRLSLKDGVPTEGKTVCVLSVLLTGEKAADGALRRLEEFCAASRSCGENLLFGLLCDLPESGETLSHADRALLDAAAAKTETLNARCGGGFYLFTRDRLYSHDSGKFAPWERKRGAVLELCRLLAGENTTLCVRAGDAKALRGTRYILTLDADTRLEPESARELIGAALHPLNRPAVDPKRGIVFRGHGVLHPRVAVSLESAYRNDCTRLFAPAGGGDPYGSDAGEVYMDAFQSGGFAGKGLIHVGAYLACLGERIPEGRVLSHDALEGAFLRGGYVSDVELTDGFPSGAVSYYARAHRWMRGDVQNLPWLFRRGKALPPIERWRLFDSLRRALLPVGLFVSFGAWFLFPNAVTRLPALCALFVLFLPVLRYCFGVLFRDGREVRYKSAVLHGLGGELTRVFTHMLFLAAEAWTSVSAIVLALWRMLVSHRRLLQWQTAEQSERRSADLAGTFAAMWPVVYFSGLLLAFSQTFAGRAAAICWIFTPLIAHRLGREKKEKPLDGGEREFLLRRAAEIWRYFRENCTAASHHLPPDNVQLSPPASGADRTSPTNIAMALAGALSALELGIASETEALTLCENILDTVERLPRWKGHLYNWYDTKTLAPLDPAYVSTVDSGNLAAALTACAAGFAAHGAPVLAKRAGEIAAAMDFHALYDEKRRLFRIGLLPGASAPAQSWYDLLESEERLTAYFTIASGQIEHRHWRQLSRAQVGCRGRRGMVSWSGSLFEYLMPELFLPLYRGSHLWESARFAVYVQRRRTFGAKKLWGISESAFYAFDATDHYRYKAHGCAPLALCRGGNGENVVSPYSSYLALCAAPHAAVENLRRMTETGLSGPYGLWEAVDFTSSRTGGGPVCVRCVMAHHLGMSLCAIANALCGGVLRRWFLSDPAMAAYTGLLQEKIPMGGKLLRREPAGGGRAERAGNAAPRTGEGADPFFPDGAALSNGAYRLLVTANGMSRASCGALIPYRSARTPWEDAPGIMLWAETGGVRRPLLPKPWEKSALRWRFISGEACLSGQSGELLWEMRCVVSRAYPGELRRLRLRSGSAAPDAVIFGFEPVLLDTRDYAAHPAFARLGLCTTVKDGVLIVYRAPRGKQSAQYLALACSQEAEFSSDFRQFPARSGAGEFRENTGWQNEPYIAARLPLPEGSACEIALALCVAGDADTAALGAREMLRETSGFAMADAAAAVWGMESGESAAAMEYLRALTFPPLCAEGRALPGGTRDALWRLGISGDLPVMVFDGGENGTETALRELRRHALLGACGVEYDLVFLTAPAGDYRNEQRAAIETALEAMRLSETLSLPGGVYFASRGEREALLAAAALFGDAAGTSLPAGRARSLRLPPAAQEDTGTPPVSYTDDGEVSFQTPPVPPRAWGNMLYGGGLGCAAADSGPAALWLENARECPVVPWSGDALAAAGAERLWIETEHGAESLFSDGGACSVTFGFGYARWERDTGGNRVSVTAFIVPDTPVRVLLLESGAPCEVSYFAPVQLAPEREDAASASVWRDGSALRAENPRCPYKDVRVTLRCSAPWVSAGTNARFLCGEGSGTLRRGFPALAGTFRLEKEAVLLLGTADVPALLDIARAREELTKTKAWWAHRVRREKYSAAMPECVRHLAPWSAYAALCCRVLGRGSLYQSGGAVGFRDQLQDRINLLPIDAAGARAHILACCAHQYAEGDVQHWYHPTGGETDKGVRTDCSDDLLWLPWAVCEYVRATGDESLCAEAAPYIASPPLARGEHSRYETPALSGESGTVLDHCHRAAALVLRRGVGEHRLLRMGGGDWNDGFDAMGESAESVWLTWFASGVFHDFSALLTRLGESGADRYETAAAALGAAANEAWDVDHYLRGYYADGTPLGASGAAACRIDSVAQSFAAFSPYADRDRVQTALTAALDALWDREKRLIRIYAPSFLPEERAPGYVSTYGPGFRENGGQYTHAAVWLALALHRAGRREEAAALAEDMALSLAADGYGAEPFVLSADIAYAPGKEGRAGWSWYTGAAGWYLRLLRGLYGAEP